ncbi:MAG TPA: hypothetical protein DCG85_06410 [Lachnospiraceae bacterium]|nr:hypothetical protein [Lachnospiraceae bacterium]
MNKKYVNVLALAAMILQTIAVVTGFGMVFMQKTLMPIFIGRAFEPDSPVIPPVLIFMALQLIIYIVFYCISAKDGYNFTVIVLIFLSILLAFVSVVGNVIGNIYFARMGAEKLAAYSSVSTLLSYVNTVFGAPAAPLFYIACGRRMA